MANERLDQKPTITTLDATTLVAVTTEISGVRRVRQAPTALFKGLDGKSAIAIITDTTPAAIPAIGQDVQYTVDSSSGLAVDQIVAVGAASTLKVVSTPTPASIILRNVDAPLGSVATGTKIVPSAKNGAPGANSTVPGPPGANAFTTVTNQFSIPAFNTDVTVVVGASAFLSIGMFVQVGGYFFRVAAIASSTQITLTNSLDGQSGNIAANTKIVAAGEPGTNGISAIATTTGSPPNIPNYNASADYVFDNASGLILGQYYGFEGISGSLLIASKNGNTVTLKNISILPATVVATGIKIAPVGKSGAASFAVTTNSSNTVVPGVGLNFSLNFDDTSPFPIQGAIAVDGIAGVAIVIGKTGNLLTLQNDSIAPNTIIQPARTVFNAGRRGADANISSAAAITLTEAVAPTTSATQMGIYIDPSDKRLKKKEQSNGESSLLIGVIYAPTTSPPVGSTSYDWVATDIDEKHYWKPTGNAGAGIWVQYTG